MHCKVDGVIGKRSNYLLYGNGEKNLNNRNDARFYYVYIYCTETVLCVPIVMNGCNA